MRTTLLFSLVPTLLSAVQLQFTPDVTVAQRHTVIVEMEQKLPHEDERSRMEQVMDWEIRVPSYGSLEPVERPPLDLQLTLVRCQVTLEKGEQRTQLDTENEVQVRDPFVARLKQLVGRPIDLRVGEDWKLTEGSEELSSFLRQVPSLSSHLPKSFFVDLIDPLVALAGEALEKGESRERSLALGSDQAVSYPVHYRVTSANLREVEASLEGKVSDKLLSLPNGEARLTGGVKGSASWTRRNALEAQLQRDERYHGKIVLGEEEWPLTLAIRQRVESKRKS